MKAKMINEVHIEGRLYEHDLQMRESGPNSKNPGTQFIMGNIQVATDDECVNVVPIHFTYVTATTAKGTANTNFNILRDIIDGKLESVTSAGIENAAKLRIDTSIALNEFYTDRNGETELVSAKRNEGGFIHLMTNDFAEDEKDRNYFKEDMVITKVTRVEANEERGLSERVNIKGYIFDFRKAVLPVEFIATNPAAMDYFEDLGATEKDPVFTNIKGRQISTTVVRKIEEQGAFGEPHVREVKNSRKEFLIWWAQENPYVWDDEKSITAAELSEALANREIYLASVKQRQDEYNATKNQPKAPTKGAFNF